MQFMRRVFSFDLKEESKDECLTETGREFQIFPVLLWFGLVRDLSASCRITIASQSYWLSLFSVSLYVSINPFLFSEYLHSLSLYGKPL